MSITLDELLRRIEKLESEVETLKRGRANGKLTKGNAKWTADERLVRNISSVFPFVRHIADHRS